METVSRNVNFMARLHRWRWVRYALIAEAFLLILIIGSAGLVAAWVMLNDTTPCQRLQLSQSVEFESY